MKAGIRRTGLKELEKETAKKGPAKKKPRITKQILSPSDARAGLKKAKKTCREALDEKEEFFEDIPPQVYSSLLELDAVTDTLYESVPTDEFGNDVKYNESYFAVSRAYDLILGINHRLNRVSTAEKKAGEADKKKIERMDRLYGMTSMLEEKIRTYKDSLEREYGPFIGGPQMGIQIPAKHSRPEDD